MSHENLSTKSRLGSERTIGKSENLDAHSSHSHAHHNRPTRLSDTSQGPGLLEMVAGDEPEEEGEVVAARSSSIIKFYPDWCRCCVKTSGPLSDDAPFKEQLKDFFQWPPKGTFGRYLLFVVLCLSMWGLLFYLFQPLSRINKDGKHEKETNPAWIHGPLFALGIVEITGLASGILLKKFLNLPPLLGPLVLGIIYHNIPALNVFTLMTSYELRNCTANDKFCNKWADHSINNWVKPIRIIALGIILTRAGLELSPKQLSKLKGVVPSLAFGPCIVEAMVCALFSYIFFHELERDKNKKITVAMCFVAGFALAAVSPAVVVPGALSLKKEGLGVVKGVPTLLIAASSIDDVLAISAYTIALGFALSSENDKLWQTYSGGAIGIVVGVVHGIVFGMLLHFVPTITSKYKAENRLLLLLLINFVSVLAYEETFYNGAGSVSVLMTSLVAGFGWRSQAHWKRPMKKIEKTLAHMWVLWVPLIFGTIGKEINFKAPSFQPPDIFKIFGVIGISLVFRCFAAFLIVGCRTTFNLKERLFIALSWIPKATVQAALAPLVITRANEGNEDGPAAENAKINAERVVNIAILAVLITAPIGCVLIAFTGKKLLEQNSKPEITMQVEDEFPNGEGIDPADSTFDLVADARMITRKSMASNHDINRTFSSERV